MEPANQQHGTRFTPVTLEALRGSLSLFAQERQWEKFHTPRNLVLALVGEVTANMAADVSNAVAPDAAASHCLCHWPCYKAGHQHKRAELTQWTVHAPGC